MTRLCTQCGLFEIHGDGGSSCQILGGNHNFILVEQRGEAKRDEVNYRYDILDARFEQFKAQLAAYGAKKYGDFNWKKSRLEGEKGPINHIHQHLNNYRQRIPYDHVELGEDPKFHLVAIAFNAMMEFWYEENLPKETTGNGNPKTD